MIAPSPEFQNLTDALRRYAAVSGPFQPMEALREVAGEDAFADQVLMVEALSALREDCTVEPAKGGEAWLMRPGPRRKVLAGMEPGAAKSASRGPTAVEAAVAGEGRFAPEAIDRLIDSETDTETLTELAVALDRAGPGAPAFDRLVALRSALNRARQARQTDEALASGFFGRDQELADLGGWIEAHHKGQVQTAHVSGLPGIGKSFLLERMIQKARDELAPVLVRLDFDRSGLQVLDPYPLFEEISRQVGDNLPAAAANLRAIRLESAEEAASLGESSQRQGLPRNLLKAIAEAVEASGRPMLLVLDTLEVLRSEGETHVLTLFDHLDRLAEFGVPDLTVVSAGRGDALGPVTARVGRTVPLRGLDDDAARRVLEKREVDQALWPRILRLANGNPLLLTLAAKAMEHEDFDEGELPEGAGDAAVAGYLYRAILSRVPEELKRVANEGLILRRIDARTLAEIVAPALGLPLDEAQAARMLADLSRQHWLVQHVDGWIQHRPDVRSAILGLIYRADPDVTAEIDRRAAEWFALREPVTALYHRLQLTRAGIALPRVPADLARDFTDPMLEDLPERARDAVLQARGQRSGYGRPDAEAAAPPEPAVKGARRVASRDIGAGREPPQHLRYDPAVKRVVFVELAPGERIPPLDERAVRDLEMMLEKGALREASYVLSNGFDLPFAADSPAAAAVLAHQWQTGQWSIAERLFRLAPGETLDRCLAENPYLMGRIMLELWAEFRFDDLVVRLEAPDLFGQAMGLLRDSAHLGLSGGALDFALICAAPDGVPPGDLSDGLAVLAPALRDSADEIAFEALERARSWRQSMGLDLPEIGTEDLGRAPERVAAALMPLSPYAGPIQAHVRAAEEGEGSAVLGWLDALRPALPEAAARFAPDLRGVDALAERLSSSPSDVAQALSAMGLTADWAEGYTFFRPVPDLPTIAAAAERWRRTVNGLWSYGRRRPPGWGETRDTDWAAAALAERLMGSPEPEAEARRALRFWADPTGTDPEFGRAQARRRLLHRYLAAFECAGDTPGPALAALQKGGVPGTLAAPLAVLASLGVHPDKALPTGGQG